MKHPEQRVGVFIDVANMYYSARSSYNAKVNFGKVVETALAGRRLVRAIAYAVKADMPEEQGFFDALHKMGIEVYTKDLQTFYDGSKKGNVDMELAIDALKLAPKLDVVVVVSGDGDYCILLEHLKAQGCRVEVIGFGKSASSRLREVADDFINLEEDAAKYLIRSRDGTSRIRSTSSAPRAAAVRTVVQAKPAAPAAAPVAAPAVPPAPAAPAIQVHVPQRTVAATTSISAPHTVAPAQPHSGSAPMRPAGAPLPRPQQNRQPSGRPSPQTAPAAKPSPAKSFKEQDIRHLATMEKTWKKYKSINQ